MSVRPITISEENKARGHPWVNVFAVFGATQGLLIYLNRTRMKFNQNWFAAPGSPKIALILIGGGFLIGGGIGMAAFTDHELLRLSYRHQEDKIHLIEGQSINHFKF